MIRVLAVLLLAWIPQALACGVCLEDKVASCYDHAVVTGALERGDAVGFYALQGALVRSPETERAVRQAAESARGVRRGSVRVSLDNAALSFAFDPARTNPARAQGEIERRLARLRLELLLLKLLDDKAGFPRSRGGA